MSVTAQYVTVSNGLGGLNLFVSDVTLLDEDLIRGDDANEQVLNGAGRPIFDGFTEFVQTGFTLGSVVRQSGNTEVTTTVTFTDGTSLSGVLGLRDFGAGSYGSSYNRYLLDVNELSAVGKTLDDIADVRNDGAVNHNLSWADLGFSGDFAQVDPIDPVDPIEPIDPVEPVEPEAIIIEGTQGRDRLRGTSEDEIIIGGNGNDVLFGGGGADTFVFGADTNDGNRDRDVIRDFDMSEDLILLDSDAQIRRVVERGDNVVIQLEGDRDVIVVRDADASIVDNIIFDDLAFA